MPDTILIVEDEPEFAGLVELWMSRAGYRTVMARTGPDALRGFYEDHPDLVILDVALPGLDGWQIIERIREFSRIPILMVTARSSEADKIRGLKLGARRLHHQATQLPGADRPESKRRSGGPRPRRPTGRDDSGIGTWSSTSTNIAPVSRGNEVRLTPTEFRLLSYLLEHAGQLVTHRQVLGAVWGSGYDVDVHLLRMTIRNLRLKLDAVAPGESYIATEYGLGYRLTGPAPSADVTS